MAALQKFCLKWNNFQNSVTSVFENLRQDEELVDITLCCEGQKIKAHRMMLSACSPYFRDLLKENPCQHPVFFLKDTSYPDLAAVVEFVYKGEVNVLQSQLGSFLKTAEMLQVKGLSGDDDDDGPSRPGQPGQPGPPGQPSQLPAAPPPADRPGEYRLRQNSSQPTAASPLRSKTREPPDFRPSSPRFKRRRLSGGDGRPGSPSPLPPVSAAQAGPPPPPPPPPPAVSAAQIDLEPPALAAAPVSSASLESALDSRPLLHHSAPPPPRSPVGPPMVPHHSAHHHHGAAAAQPPAQQHGDDSYNIKVEKVDITDGDDDVSLEETLGHVSNMEAAQFEGSDHSTSSHDMAGLLSRLSEQGGSGDMSMAGTAGTSEDGSSQAGAGRAPLHCSVCWRAYTNPQSLQKHLPVHRGDTTCRVCGRVFDRVARLNSHVRAAHPGYVEPPGPDRA